MNTSTLQQITDYLDTLPGVLALYWFLENVSDDHPYRSDLFFYCRERARRYQDDSEQELEWDRMAFQQIAG